MDRIKENRIKTDTEVLDELEKWLEYNWGCNKDETGLYCRWVTYFEILEKIKKLKRS